MKQYSTLYKNELLSEVIPFWEKHSPDLQNGGYFTCLLADGTVYDTDKFIWLQARQVWMFSKLYNQVEPRESWRQMAKLGADFLEKHGSDANGQYYFSLEQSGKPLVQPYNIFSDCFAAMAFGEYYKLTQSEHHRKMAEIIFSNILKRQNNPKGPYNKVFPGTRPLQNFALPMILCNLTLELEHILGTAMTEEVTTSVTRLILEEFVDPETGLILENTKPGGEFSNSFEGRLLNPGHAIEAMWFLMNIGLRQNDQELVKKAEELMFLQLENGWDEQYGGIFYFLDIKGYPPQQLEWDQKLWWVHLETLVALAKTWKHTGNPKAKIWFEKVHDYTWKHFRDAENGGEWYGYLNRQGSPLLQLKGGKWKGCFHVPRALMEIWKTLED